MKRTHRLAGALIVLGLLVMLATFRLATAPGFLAMLSGATLVVVGMGWFVVDLLRGS